MTLPQFSFLAPPIQFGVGTAERISQHITCLSAKHVLLVSDKGLEKAGLVDQLAAWIRLGNILVTTYTDIEPEPSVDNVRACVAFARSAGCDLVVGLGGGSAMDSAKVVAALMGNSGDVMDYLGMNKIPTKGVPTILLPTTAGTGSEIGRGSLFYVPERKSKEAVFSSFMLTDLALIDPALGVTAPASVTAASGLDALCHAIESYTGRAANALSKPFAELGIRVITRNLATAVLDGKNIEAREGMALGCLYASIALANANTHAVHALAYPLQGKNRIVHGKANSVLLPYVLEELSPSIPDQFSEIAGFMGIDITNVAAKEIGRKVAATVSKLSVEIGVPTKMSLLGVQADQIESFTEEAYGIRRLLDNCPVELSEKRIYEIFEKAL
jgi:alcohol dehydrogenase